MSTAYFQEVEREKGRRWGEKVNTVIIAELKCEVLDVIIIFL